MTYIIATYAEDTAIQVFVALSIILTRKNFGMNTKRGSILCCREDGASSCIVVNVVSVSLVGAEGEIAICAFRTGRT